MKNARLLLGLAYGLVIALCLLAGVLAPAVSVSAWGASAALFIYALLAQFSCSGNLADAARISSWAIQAIASLITLVLATGHVFWPSNWWSALAAVVLALCIFITAAWHLLVRRV